jgi:hypothetical protein
MDICVADELHLFVAVALLNISLYLLPCLQFDSFWYKACMAADMGVLLKTMLETAIGPEDGHWPQDAGSNLFIVLCFSLFFYVIGPQIYGTLFLFLGLLSVQAFWDGVYAQMQSFMQNSLDIIMDKGHVNVVYAVIIFVIGFALVMSLFFAVPTVRLFTMGITTAVKLVISFKVLYIVVFKNEKICCATDSDPANCPIWITKTLWIVAGCLAAARIAAAQRLKSQPCCSKRPQYKLLPEDQISEATDEDDASTTSPSNKQNSKGNKLRVITIGKPRLGITRSNKRRGE